MSELGELLELLYGARDRVRTARLLLRQRRNELLAQDAVRREVPEASDGHSVFSVHLSPLGDDGEFPDGAIMRSVDDSFGAIEDDAEGMTESWEPLLDPAPLLGALRVERGGEARCAGRDAIRVTGTPRSRHEHGLQVLGFFGADELELLVDAERGIVLRADARSQGESFAVWEAREVAVDEPVPDELLRLELPADERFRAPRELEPQERLTVEEAVARASFDVWIPPELPGDVVAPDERHTTALVLDDRDGTHIALQSTDLEPELLLDLAVSLVPAR